MQKWEYFTLTWNDIYSLKDQDINKYLNNTYGENGWELISVAVYPSVHGSISTGTGYGSFSDVRGNTNTTFSTILFFKRPK